MLERIPVFEIGVQRSMRKLHIRLAPYQSLARANIRTDSQGPPISGLNVRTTRKSRIFPKYTVAGIST